MIGHIHLMCKDWGQAKRLMWAGKNKSGDPTGWPLRSVQGKIKEDWDGSARTARDQHYAEVFSGNALDIARALHGSSFDDFCLAVNHYVIGGKMEEKLPRYAQLVDRKVAGSAYWIDIHGLHKYLEGRLSRLEAA